MTKQTPEPAGHAHHARCDPIHEGVATAALRASVQAKIDQDIRETGWTVVWVGADWPWAYTVAAPQGPMQRELCLAPLAPRHANDLLNDAVKAMRAGVDVCDRVLLAESLGLDGAYIAAKPVHETWLTSALFSVAKLWHNTTTAPPYYQLVLADEHGRFPWDEAHDIGFPQPVLWEPRPVNLTHGWTDAPPPAQD